MKQSELEAMLEAHPPGEILARHRDDLSRENLEFLEAFSQFDQSLEQLPAQYDKAMPDAPSLPKLELGETLNPPWYRRTFSLNPLQGMLAAAALISIGFLAFYLAHSKAPSANDPWGSALSITRSGKADGALRELDLNLVEALLDRGYHFFEKGDVAGFGQARDHFQMALAIDPNNTRILKSLILCYEMLDDPQAVKKYQKRLESVEKPEVPAPDNRP